MSINPVAQSDAAKVVFQVSTTNANQTQPETQKPTPVNTQPPATDTVKISSAAQTAAKEATKTAAQPAQEVGADDRQVQKLLAKEATAKEAKESPLVKPQEVQGTLVNRFFNNIK
jgi:hypothetical protein